MALGFIDALETAYRHIGRHPASGSSRCAVALSLPGLRSRLPGRFSHTVFYREEKDRIDVWRVLHSARDVPVWMRGEQLD